VVVHEAKFNLVNPNKNKGGERMNYGGA